MSTNENGTDPRQKLFGNFFERMQAKKIKDAAEEAQLLADTIKQRAREFEENTGDEGPKDFTIGNQDGRVLIVFPHTVDWLGFSPEEAVIVAAALTEHAAAALRWTPPEPAETTPVK